MLVKTNRRWWQKWKPAWVWEAEDPTLTLFDNEPTRPWHRARSCKIN
jgi:hypothetical protein